MNEVRARLIWGAAQATVAREGAPGRAGSCVLEKGLWAWPRGRDQVTFSDLASRLRGPAEIFPRSCFHPGKSVTPGSHSCALVARPPRTGFPSQLVWEGALPPRPAVHPRGSTC